MSLLLVCRRLEYPHAPLPIRSLRSLAGVPLDRISLVLQFQQLGCVGSQGRRAHLVSQRQALEGIKARLHRADRVRASVEQSILQIQIGRVDEVPGTGETPSI